MEGIEAARKLVAGRLAGELPGKLAELRARYLADPDPAADIDLEGALPDVRLVADAERFRLEAEEWPAVCMARLRVPNMRVVDVVDGRLVLRVTYRLRAYVYARGQTFDDVTDKVDRYLLAVRELLLANLGLGADPALGAFVDPATMAEEYAGVEVDENSRTVGGAYVEFSVVLQEELAGGTLPPGAPAEVAVAAGTVTVQPAHPALD